MVRIGIVGRFEGQPVDGEDEDERAGESESEVEDQAVADQRERDAQEDGPVRRRWEMDVVAVAGLGDLFGLGHADEAVVVGLAVLAVPELVAVRDDGRVVEVVRRRGRGGHPLERAGVPRVGTRVDPAGLLGVAVRHPDVDEEEVKQSLLAEGANPLDISKNLAELKSIRVSSKHPDRIVIGADSVISLNEELINKPNSREEAYTILKKLNNLKHYSNYQQANLR